MRYIFSTVTAFIKDISQWDMSKVSSMQWMFRSVAAFDQDISQWDVSKVTTITYMSSATAVFCQDTGMYLKWLSWGTSFLMQLHSTWTYIPACFYGLDFWFCGSIQSRSEVVECFPSHFHELDVCLCFFFSVCFCWGLHPNVSTSNMFFRTQSNEFDCST